MSDSEILGLVYNRYARNPDDLVTITEKPNLDAIAAYLEKHGESTLAHFGERGESLRIK